MSFTTFYPFHSYGNSTPVSSKIVALTIPKNRDAIDGCVFQILSDGASLVGDNEPWMWFYYKDNNNCDRYQQIPTTNNMDWTDINVLLHDMNQDRRICYVMTASASLQNYTDPPDLIYRISSVLNPYQFNQYNSGIDITYYNITNNNITFSIIDDYLINSADLSYLYNYDVDRLENKNYLLKRQNFMLKEQNTKINNLYRKALAKLLRN